MSVSRSNIEVGVAATARASTTVVNNEDTENMSRKGEGMSTAGVIFQVSLNCLLTAQK